jgi:hypothetical protein
MKSKCRDCGRRGNEDPDDPAPNLCPPCYRDRLERILPLFEAKLKEVLEDSDDLTPAIVWIAKALEEIGGETPAYARLHAHQLAVQMVLVSEGRMN